jgi:Ca2+-transporting ATPase
MSTTLNYYRLTAEQVLDELGSTRSGLATKEIRKRLEQFGPNSLNRTKHDSVLTIAIRQVNNLLVVMLLVSAGLAVYLHDGKTASILFAIALMNTAVGFFQEYKASSLLGGLERLLVPRTKVLRSGTLIQIDSAELVMGDVVYVESGDSVPADLRVIEEDELSCNDFALTGESNPSRKFVHAIGATATVGNRGNLLFMSTTVASGTAYGVVVATGMRTELGRIAGLSQVAHSPASPLQKEMSHLSTRLAQGTIILSGLLAYIAYQSDISLQAAILFGVGIGAAMIPSGLVAEVNITLAQTAARLARARALVKKLSAVETLGATNVILTDKTGTLTKNEMTVQQLVIGRTNYAVSGTGYEANGEILSEHGKRISSKQLQEIELFFAAGVLASNAKVNPPDGEHAVWHVLGDPTEGALITLARKAGINPEAWETDNPEIKEFQFDSARKLLSSVRRRGGKHGQIVVFTKGAPESVLERSTSLWDHGHNRRLNAADREFFTVHNQELAHAAKRNLAYAYRILPATTNLKNLQMDKVERNLTFLGMVSMVDPLRDDVPAAMRSANNAHIKVSIITGDSPLTAKAIACKAGLAKDIVIVEGADLPNLADSQILRLVEKGGAIFSRVAPEDKLRIVEIVKQSGRVVAVTGDGINDAPALKRADIGVAMGRTGTDVAKDAAEIILLDDSFNTLIGAVKEGRLTFKNIRKAARCALTANASELLVVVFGLIGLSLLHVPPAISAIQILAIDIVAQILPITALGWDSAKARIMHEKPRNRAEHIINKQAVSGFLGFGLLAAMLSYGNYLFFFVRAHLSPAYLDIANPQYLQATTITYVTLVLCLYVYLLFERADAHEKFFTNYLWSNKKLLGAFGISLAFIGAIIYIPILQTYFRTQSLDWKDWLTAIVCAAAYFAVRSAQRHTRKHSRRAVVALHKEVHG